MRWMRWGGLAVLLLAAGLAGAFAVYRARALPQADGALVMPGLSGEVRIERDGFGIPTIRAGSQEDADFALQLCAFPTRR